MTAALIVTGPATGFTTVTGKVTPRWPGGTVAVAGTVAAAGLLLVRLTAIPVEPASPLRDTVHMAATPLAAASGPVRSANPHPKGALCDEPTSDAVILA